LDGVNAALSRFKLTRLITLSRRLERPEHFPWTCRLSPQRRHRARTATDILP